MSRDTQEEGRVGGGQRAAGDGTDSSQAQETLGAEHSPPHPLLRGGRVGLRQVVLPPKVMVLSGRART